MARYEIPQYIDVENKVVGPITFKQLIYFFAIAALLGIFWFVLRPLFFFILAIPTVIATLVFAFMRIEGRSFFSFFYALMQYMVYPQTFIWKRKRPEVEKDTSEALGILIGLPQQQTIDKETKQTTTEKLPEEKLEAQKEKQIHQIAQIMDNF